MPLLWNCCVNGKGADVYEDSHGLKAGEVRLDPGTTKNLEGRVFYLTSELKELLKAQRKAADRIQRRHDRAARLLPRRAYEAKHGEVGFWSGHSIAASGFYHAWCRARIVAGCPGSIPHDFRRTAIRNMVRAGISERVAIKLSGHKTRSVFDRYNVVSDGDLREASNRLGHSFGHSTASVTGRGKRNPQNC